MAAMSQWTILTHAPAPVETVPAREHPELLAAPTAEAVAGFPAEHPVDVFAIDPDLADTAALTEAYGLKDQHSANCVIVAGSRAGEERIAACMVLAHTRADVNKRVRKLLDVRKASFMDQERACAESGMEYGGIGPFGLPDGYRILIDSRIVAEPEVVIGSGIRGSKIILSGQALAALPGAEVIEDLAIDV